MDVRFINPFIIATSEVLEQGVQLQAVRGQISLRKSAHTTEEVTLLIHLTGQVEGMVACGISEDTARALVSEMIGEECSAMDHLAQGAIGELGKRIADLASTDLSKNGYTTRVSPP